MIVLAGYVRVPETAKAQLQPYLEIFVAATRAEPGCRDFWFAFDSLDPECMRVFEIFDDEEAFAAHRNSAHMAEWRAARERLGIVGRVLTRYEISAHESI